MNSIPTVTPEQATRAIYLDFESEGDSRSGEEREQVLGGTLVEEVYTPVLLIPLLEEAASANGWQHRTLGAYLIEVYERACTEGRLIVYFSSKEKDLFEAEGIVLGDRGCDLAVLARRYKRRSRSFKDVWDKYSKDKEKLKTTRAKTTRKKLKTKVRGLLTLLAAEIGLPRPGSYGAGLVGKRIRDVKSQAKQRDCYEKWTPTKKGMLTKLVNHNKHDCLATRHVLQHILDNPD
jgi:hypothetical protein